MPDIGAGLAIGGALIGADASRSAANTQADAANNASAQQRYMFDQTAAMQKPWRDAGENALKYITEGIAPGGRYMTNFGMDQFQADPGYGFRMAEGLKALDRQAAARGGLISGGALKGAQRYGQDMASQEYGNAFNRYQQETGNQFNRLAGVAGVGQTAVNQLGNFGQTAATQIGNNMMGAGNARASGYVGSANAIAGGLGQVGNNYMQNNMLRNMQMSNLQNQYGYGNVYGAGGASTGSGPLSITDYSDF